MSRPNIGGPLLALDAGVSQSGWAVFIPSGEVYSGVIAPPSRRSLKARTRLSYLSDSLDLLASKWLPVESAYSQASGIHWEVPALQLLEDTLRQWAERHLLPLFPYTAQEVRTAVTVTRMLRKRTWPIPS